MPLTNLRIIDDQQTIQSRAEADTDSSDEQAGPRLISVRKGRRLDVDEVLARSLPSLTVKGLSQEKTLSRI